MNTFGKLKKTAAMARSALRYALSPSTEPSSGMWSFFHRLTTLSLDYVEVSVTKACTLRCHACRHLMPYYKHPKNYHIGNVIRDVDAFLQSVSHIAMLRILGGEPFLHGNLDQLLNHLSRSNKVASVHVVTNGTLVPEKGVLCALKASRAVVDLSDYGSSSTKIGHLIETLNSNSISYEIIRQPWIGFGAAVARPYTPEQLSRIFFKCTLMEHKCFIVSDGMFHICARSANATELGIVERRAIDYVDLVHTPRDRIGAKIRRLILFADYVEACRTCEEGFRSISVAEQVNAPKHW